MVQILKLDHLEYKEAIMDGPEFREKLRKHEKHIADTSKNIKILLKKLEDVLVASESLKNAQDSFSLCLKDFQLGFVGDTNEEESDIVDSLDCTHNLFQDIKEFSNKMINTGQTLIKQLEMFRKDKLDGYKEKKKDYERQTTRYCTTIEKYLQSQMQSSSKKDRNNEDLADVREIDKVVKEENQLFYSKCLDYVLCIQEFEEKWFHFFAESILAFSQSWTTFYHEGYDKFIDCESRYRKSNGGIQALRNNLDYFKSKSKELIGDILREPEFHISSYQSMSSEHNMLTSKQGYLYLIEKKTLGSSTRIKQFCKYFKETKKLEVITFSQTANKTHQAEVFYVNNCQKSTSSDKRFVFEVSLRDKNVYTNVHTYQALSYDDYKAWFAIMEGKELTPVLSTYSIKTDPIYLLDRNGIIFIKKCIQLLEDEKLNEEGIYRKNGVSHKINQFIERNFVNISSIANANSNSNSLSSNHNSSSILIAINDHLSGNHNQSNDSTHNTSFISNVLKSAANLPIITHSTSFSTLSFLVSNQSSGSTNTSTMASANTTTTAALTNQNNNQSTSQSPSTAANTNASANNSSHSNLISAAANSSNSIDCEFDTCTITSALKHYLIHLKEPLMTFSFNEQFLQTCKKENLVERITEIHKLLHSLPVLNFEALELLIKHLYKVSTHCLQNKMTTSNLATCFGPTVFRTEQECVSNLYNIKFYSEIVELLIVNNEHIFQPKLDSAFLNNLIPLKTPPTMMSGTLTHLSGSNLSNNSNISVNTSAMSANTPLSLNQSKLKTHNLMNPNGKFNLNDSSNFKKAIMNSSKTSVSSDSSQSDREPQLNTSLNQGIHLLSQHIVSPLSASSPTHTTSAITASKKAASTNSSANTIENTFLNSTITTNTSTSTSNSNTSSSNNENSNISLTRYSNLPNFFTHHSNGNGVSATSNTTSFSLPVTNTMSVNKPFKPFNSQNSQYQLRENDLQRLNINSGNKNVGAQANVNSKSSSLSPTVNNKSQQISGNKGLVNSSNLNSLNFSLDSTNSLNNTSTIKYKRARTLYPCEADNPSELSFEANVIISNVRKSKESGWLEGTYNGKSGLVPGNYVQILED